MSTGDAFAEVFRAGWAAGGPAERFLEAFLPHTDPDVLLVQPLTPTARGHAGMRRQFEAAFRATPDLTAVVHSHAATDDGVLIHFTLSCTVGGRPLAWDAIDRIVLRDGLMVSRHSYFDSLPLFGSLLRRPRALARLLPLLRPGKDPK